MKTPETIPQLLSAVDALMAYRNIRSQETNTRVAPNGELHVTLCSGGPKAEGESTPAFPDERSAVGAWWLHFTEYLRQAQEQGRLNPESVLYWRVKPYLQDLVVTMREIPDPERPGCTTVEDVDPPEALGCTVRARLLLA